MMTFFEAICAMEGGKKVMLGPYRYSKVEGKYCFQTPRGDGTFSANCYVKTFFEEHHQSSNWEEYRAPIKVIIVPRAWRRDIVHQTISFDYEKLTQDQRISIDAMFEGYRKLKVTIEEIP